MELDHTFTVPVGLDDAFAALTDIERVAPCMPGATLDTLDGDEFTGTVKVKLGPIGLTYKGNASVIEKDAVRRRVVMTARGRDVRGNGTAAATVTATLSTDGDSTRVDVRTDLDITGKPAQFGRGVMIDVGNKLIGQFADSLAKTLGEASPAGCDAAHEPAAPTQKQDGTVPDAIPLLRTVGPALAKRGAAPLVVLTVVLLVLSWLRRFRLTDR